MGSVIDERAIVTARLARLAERQRAASAAYTALLDRAPSSGDEEALEAWRRELDDLYAKKDAIVARRIALRRRLVGLSDTQRAA